MCCTYRLVLGLLFCMGCGSVKDGVGHLPDAPPASDAGTDAVTRGTVTVTVLDPAGSGVPAVGASVVFLDPGGTLVKTAATDTSGNAQAEVLPGGSVTSVAAQTTGYQIQTVFAVVPGDHVILGSKSTVTTTIGNFTVSYPAYTQITPASYTVNGPCGPTTVAMPAAGGPPPTTAVLTVTSACKLDTMEITVTANDGNAKALAYLTKTGVPFAANGSATLGGTYQSALSYTGNYTNVSPNIASLGMTRRVPDGFAAPVTGTVAPPTATQAVTVTGAIGTTAQVETQVVNASSSQQRVRKVFAGAKASDDIDLSATLLPWLGAPTLDASGSKITIPIDTTGTSTATPDLIEVLATYQHTDPATGATITLTWTMFSPVLGDVTLPQIPSSVGNVMPTASDTIRIIAAALESDALTSYDTIRNDPLGTLPMYTGNRPLGTMLRTSFSPLNLR